DGLPGVTDLRWLAEPGGRPGVVVWAVVTGSNPARVQADSDWIELLGDPGGISTITDPFYAAGFVRGAIQAWENLRDEVERADGAAGPAADGGAGTGQPAEGGRRPESGRTQTRTPRAGDGPRPRSGSSGGTKPAARRPTPRVRTPR